MQQAYLPGRFTREITRGIYEVIDTDQGGQGFKTLDKFRRVEVLFRTKRNDLGQIEPSFRKWEEISHILKGEKHINIVTYHRVKEKYKHLLEVIKRNYIEVSSTIPLNLHWTQALLKSSKK